MNKTTTHQYKIIKVTRKSLSYDNVTIKEQVYYEVLYHYRYSLFNQGWRRWEPHGSRWDSVEEATEEIIDHMNKWIEQYRESCTRRAAQKRLKEQLKTTRVEVGLCTWVVDETTQTFVKQEVSLKPKDEKEECKEA